MSNAEVRLVTFLGTGEYKEVEYRSAAVSEWRCRTRYVARAVAELHDATEVVVIGTTQSFEMHGEAIRTELGSRRVRVREVTVTAGGAAARQWELFEVLRHELAADHPVVVDITHGFRAQPFFAAAVVAYLRATGAFGPLDAVYGELSGEIWSLTPVVELVDWALALQLFERAGQGKAAGKLASRRGNALGKAWAAGGKQGERSQLSKLAKAIETFSDRFDAVRTGALLAGEAQSVTRELVQAIEATRAEVDRELPPLAPMLERISMTLQPLLVESIDGEPGRQALAALARLYLDRGRLIEAGTILREAWVSAFADPAANRPGARDFDGQARDRAEARFGREENHRMRTVAGIRNPMAHAGFTPEGLQDRAGIVGSIGDNLEALVAFVPAPPVAMSPIFVNLSNHPSASWGEAQRSAALALAPALVDVPFPAVVPTATEDDLATLLDAVVAQVPPGASHAMVMGEHTLTFALVTALRRRGVVCLAAVGPRIAEEFEDGSKLSRFEFVGFRKYGRGGAE